MPSGSGSLKAFLLLLTTFPIVTLASDYISPIPHFDCSADFPQKFFAPCDRDFTTCCDSYVSCCAGGCCDEESYCISPGSGREGCCLSNSTDFCGTDPYNGNATNTRIYLSSTSTRPSKSSGKGTSTTGLPRAGPSVVCRDSYDLFYYKCPPGNVCDMENDDCAVPPAAPASTAASVTATSTAPVDVTPSTAFIAPSAPTGTGAASPKAEVPPSAGGIVLWGCAMIFTAVFPLFV